MCDRRVKAAYFVFYIGILRLMCALWLASSSVMATNGKMQLEKAFVDVNKHLRVVAEAYH